MSKAFVDETLELSVSALLNFNDWDSFVSPALEYSLSDQIRLGTGAYLFFPGPERDGEYGAYKDLSCLYVRARYSF